MAVCDSDEAYLPGRLSRHRVPHGSHPSRQCAEGGGECPAGFASSVSSSLLLEAFPNSQ